MTASVQARLVGFSVDVLLVVLGTGVLLGVGAAAHLPLVLTLLLGLGGWLASTAALGAADGLLGATPGRAVAGSRLVDLDTRAPVGVERAVRRTVVRTAVGMLTLGAGWVALGVGALGDRTGLRRGPHDQRYGTLVVAAGHDPRDVVVGADVASAPDRGAPRPGGLVNVTDQRLGRTARWRLEFDSGEGVDVNGIVAVGRDPGTEPDATAPSPGRIHHVVALPTADQTLSRTHAWVMPTREGGLVVVDRSTNGTVLQRGGARRVLVPGRATSLLAGDEVRLGDRTMRVLRR